MGFSVSFRQFILAYLFKQTSIIPIPTGLFFSLHSSNPIGIGANELTAFDSPGYARAQLNPDANLSTNVNYTNIMPFMATGEEVFNNQTISWPTATSPWNSGNPILYFSVFDDSTGGDVLFDGTINGGSGIVVLSGQQLQCLANNGTFAVGS